MNRVLEIVTLILDLYVISILMRTRHVLLLVVVNLALFIAMMFATAHMNAVVLGYDFIIPVLLLCLSSTGMVANLRFLFFVVISDSKLSGVLVHDRRNRQIEVAHLANRKSIVLLVLSYMASLTCGVFLISASLMTAIRYGWLSCAHELCRQASEGPLVGSFALGNFLDQATLFVAVNWPGVALLYMASLLKLVLISLILPALLAYREAGSGAG